MPVASVLGADYDDIKHDIARIQPEARALKAALAMFSEHAVYGIEDSIADRADDLAELRKGAAADAPSPTNPPAGTGLLQSFRNVLPDAPTSIGRCRCHVT